MRPAPSAFAHLRAAARRLEASPAPVGVAELAAWLEGQGWRILAEGPGRVTAERAIIGTPHDWHVVILTQLPPRCTWSAGLYRRTPMPPSRERAKPYHYTTLGKADGLTAVADVGLWLGGWLSAGQHGDAA